MILSLPVRSSSCNLMPGSNCFLFRKIGNSSPSSADASVWTPDVWASISPGSSDAKRVPTWNFQAKTRKPLWPYRWLITTSIWSLTWSSNFGTYSLDTPHDTFVLRAILICFFQLFSHPICQIVSSSPSNDASFNLTVRFGSQAISPYLIIKHHHQP